MAQQADEQLAEVLMYTLPGCIWCTSARRRLRRHGIRFEEIPANTIPAFREFLSAQTGRSTVPQILIDGLPVGGSDSLARLDRSGALFPRIQRQHFPLIVSKRRPGLSGWRHFLQVIAMDGDVLETARVRSRAESETVAGNLERKHGFLPKGDNHG